MDMRRINKARNTIKAQSVIKKDFLAEELEFDRIMICPACETNSLRYRIISKSGDSAGKCETKDCLQWGF